MALRIILNAIADETDAQIAAGVAYRFAVKHPGRSHTDPAKAHVFTYDDAFHAVAMLNTKQWSIAAIRRVDDVLRDEVEIVEQTLARLRVRMEEV